MTKCNAALPLSAAGRSEAEPDYLSCDGNSNRTQCKHISSHPLFSGEIGHNSVGVI